MAMSHALLVDMVGERIGKLIVIARAANRNATAYWRCRCDCGDTIILCGYNLRRAQREGKELSCATCKSPAPRVQAEPRQRRRNGRLSICELCGNMPHRVERGPECPRCRTRAGADKPVVPPWRAVS
jgi:hypothetical protein